MMEVIPESIQHVVYVHAQPPDVYAAFTTAQGLDGWFTSGAEVDPRPGGSIRFRWKDWGPLNVTAEDGGPVLEATPSRRFVFQWRPDTIRYFTTVELQFKPAQGGTQVSLREYGYQNTPTGLRSMLNCATGWGAALTLLKFYVEHGRHD